MANSQNLVASLDSVGNGLKTNTSPSQLENPHNPGNPEHLDWTLTSSQYHSNPPPNLHNSPNPSKSRALLLFWGGSCLVVMVMVIIMVIMIIILIIVIITAFLLWGGSCLAVASCDSRHRHEYEDHDICND